MYEVDMEKATREEIRWRILRILDAGRPVVVSEIIVYRALNDASLSATPMEVRRHLDFLRGLELVEISNEDGPVWAAKLTPDGVNVVEYASACPLGISRPKKWA